MKRTGTISDFFGMLAGKTKKVATIEEMNAGSGAGLAGLCDKDADTSATKKSGSKKP